MKWKTGTRFLLEAAKYIIVLLATLLLFFLFCQLSIFIGISNENLETQDFLNLFLIYCILLFSSIFFVHKKYNIAVQVIISSFILFSGYLLSDLLFTPIDCDGELVQFSYSWIYIAFVLISLLIVLLLIKPQKFIINSAIAFLAFIIIKLYPFLFN